MPTSFPQNRNELGTWLNEHDLLGTGVEVGVAFGGYSRIILDKWKGKRLFLVDPWEKQDDAVYREQTNKDDKFADWYINAQRLAEQDSRVTLLKMLSVEGAKKFADGFLDVCYLDGNHSYEAVIDDLKAWWPKVRNGGLLGGHDWLNKMDEGYHCRVQDAVVDWTSKNQLPFVVTPACGSFWIVKP